MQSFGSGMPLMHTQFHIALMILLFITINKVLISHYSAQFSKHRLPMVLGLRDQITALQLNFCANLKTVPEAKTPGDAECTVANLQLSQLRKNQTYQFENTRTDAEFITFTLPVACTLEKPRVGQVFYNEDTRGAHSYDGTDANGTWKEISKTSELPAGTQIRVNENTRFNLTLNADGASAEPFQRLMHAQKQNIKPVDAWQERLSQYLVPSMIGVATLIGLSQLNFSLFLVNLVITCPCIFALATLPRTQLLAQGLTRGLIPNCENLGRKLQQLKQAKNLYLDWTGTSATPSVYEHHLETKSEEEEEQKYLLICAALEAHCQHPIAQAIRTYIQGKLQHSTAPDIELTNLKDVLARGSTQKIGRRGDYNGYTYYLIRNQKDPNQVALYCKKTKDITVRFKDVPVFETPLCSFALKIKPQIEPLKALQATGKNKAYTLYVLSGGANPFTDKQQIPKGFEQIYWKKKSNT